MSTIGQRIRNSRSQRQNNAVDEPVLNIDIDTSPNDQFREQQTQAEDDEAKKIQNLILCKLLNDEEINGNSKKIFHNYKGENVEVNVLINEMKKYNTHQYIEGLIKKYPNKTNVVSIGKLALKVIYYTFQPETDQEAAFIINSIRDGFINLWKKYIDLQIKTKKHRKTEIINILKKNTISVVDPESKNLLVIKDLKELLYTNYNIDMNVLNITLSNSTRTRSNSNSNSNSDSIETEDSKRNESNTNDMNNMIQPLIELNKKNAEKYRKLMRSEMMKLLKENMNHIEIISTQIDTIQASLEQEQLIETCEAFDRLRNELKELAKKLEKELDLYKAVPRTKKNRYVGRPEFIYDLNARIKQFTNEKDAILKKCYELAIHTRSPIIVCMASGPCYTLTKQSKSILWISPIMSFSGMQHCIEIKEIWEDYLTHIYAEKRNELQNNYEHALLENKLKQIVGVAQRDKIESILNKCKEVGLGYLLSEMDENNIEITIESDDEDELDDHIESV